MSAPQSDTFILRESFSRADPRQKLALCLSLWFGAGLMPVAPGTFGTLAALPIAVFKNNFGTFYEVLILAIVILVAVWASGVSEKLLGRVDPSEVVIDEVAGFLMTIFLLPASWLNLTLGFFLFRFYDILKPFPIGTLERRVKGGAGIVVDDLLAGVYGNLSVRVLLLLVQAIK